MKSDRELTGLGGWLVLVGIGVVANPLFVLYTVVVTFLPLFADGTLETLISIRSQFFNPILAGVVIFELAGNLVLLIVAVYAAYLFFSKSSAFPKWFIGLNVGFLLFLLLDSVVVKVTVPSSQLIDAETAKALARQFLYCLIWIPYMLTSRRVRLTFGELLPAEGIAASGHVEPVIGDAD